MNLSTIKSEVLSRGLTVEWVKEKFGDLRLKVTWESALQHCSNSVTEATEVVTDVLSEAEAIAVVSIDNIAVVANKLWEMATCDRAKQVYRMVLMGLIMALVLVGMAVLTAGRIVWESQVLQPVGLKIYRRVRRRASISRATLREWRRQAYDRVEWEWETAIDLMILGCTGR